MDPSLYQIITTSRGLKYSYYFSPAHPSKLTLLFCHGFPSTSDDWHHQALYFKGKGYGVIVPDMLGYGNTDKPSDPALYVSSAMSKDLVEILDKENIVQAVAIAHDWGCKAVSRLANYYPDRFIAYAFFAVGFLPPRPGTADFGDQLKTEKATYGYELSGFYLFFSEDDAPGIVRDHIDSSISILFPRDPKVWETRMAPTGTLEATLLENWETPLPSYMSEEDKKAFKTTFLKNGFEGPLCWYKIMTNNIQGEDDKKIPSTQVVPPSSSPIFFGAAKQDRICLPEIGYQTFSDKSFNNHTVTTHEYDADHWLILSKPDEINRDLEAWIESSGIEAN
ncbi:hypothetical protein PHLCEN_2v5251 [Hermanssonia centrifuga]|uniref:AB hydrolase-1 domain-containing protein n=1 Tax=Hermanssonia centrifuga TaxID=98765 RepID=A0A2R6P957_9APHY|nr:hypothetical protein PHLCEN_2v5251 [Hermanssonia centrifuga]